MKAYHFLYQAVIFALVIGLSACSNKNKEEINSTIVHIPRTADGNDEKTRMPKFEFEQTHHDFGKLVQGEKVSYTYKFKNAGNAMLVISAVVPSCNCSVAQFTKTPIAPGESGSITVNFNSETKKGLVNSAVTVQANTYPADTRLSFSADVKI
ncbi:MAG: DUF1573 domain-containing protein [Bacteroidales bacterium]|nr:DUF1573 domain-containing protein [Bacteroidales bacterium]